MLGNGAYQSAEPAASAGAANSKLPAAQTKTRLQNSAVGGGGSSSRSSSSSGVTAEATAAIVATDSAMEGSGSGGAAAAATAAAAEFESPAADADKRSNSGKSQHPSHPLKCPRCESSDTKFCYYNNYSLTQPRYFCKNCKRYWTAGGALRNVPVGGGLRKNKRTKLKLAAATGDVIISSFPPPPHSDTEMPTSGTDSTRFLLPNRYLSVQNSSMADLHHITNSHDHHTPLSASLFESPSSTTASSPASALLQQQSSISLHHHLPSSILLPPTFPISSPPTASASPPPFDICRASSSANSLDKLNNYIANSTMNSTHFFAPDRLQLPRLHYGADPPNYFNLLLSVQSSPSNLTLHGGVTSAGTTVSAAACNLRHDISTQSADLGALGVAGENVCSINSGASISDQMMMMKQERRDGDDNGTNCGPPDSAGVSTAGNPIPSAYADNWHMISDGIFSSSSIGDGFFYPLPGSGSCSSSWPDFSDQFNDSAPG